MDDGPDYDSVPGIAMTQWREGRVLSAEDVAMIARLLKEHDDERGRDVDLFAAAREQVLRELGGQELVDLDAEKSVLTGKLAFKRACIKVPAGDRDRGDLRGAHRGA